MNACPMGGFRGGRDEGSRGKRGDSRRQNSNNAFMDNAWKSSRANYPVDTLKLKAVTQKVSFVYYIVYFNEITVGI